MGIVLMLTLLCLVCDWIAWKDDQNWRERKYR
jgi:hypothetical protein